MTLTIGKVHYYVHAGLSGAKLDSREVFFRVVLGDRVLSCDNSKRWLRMNSRLVMVRCALTCQHTASAGRPVRTDIREVQK